MKKLIALMLILVMIFAIAACTPSGDDKDKGDQGGASDGTGGDDTGNNNPFGDEPIDLPLVDIEPDGVE